MSSTQSGLRYDPSYMVSPRGETGQRVVVNRSRELALARTAILEQRATGPFGWLDMPLLQSALPSIHKALAHQKECSTLLVLGIGGSDLGARTLVQALYGTQNTEHKASSARQVVFAGANTDPDELDAILSSLDWKKTCVNIVSKSGGTIEPMSAFFVAREKLIKMYGKMFASHIVATTDAESGMLHDLAKREGYTMLSIPKNVGGRFSVFTSAGLFPATWVGISPESLLDGAATVVQSFEQDPVEFQIAAQFAALHVEWYERYRHSQWVCMPYSSRLELFGKWYRQLFAESLGKAKNRNNITVENGPTPIAALGASDQHSQIQLYREGPRDKVVTFVEVEHFSSRLVVPELAACKELSLEMQRLSGVSFEHLIHLERQATAEALMSARRPNGTLYLPRLDAVHFGALLQTYMVTVAYLGELMDVNAYNQPGVEEGKARFWALLEGGAS